MTLKDASAYNVVFRGASPVFIDTLSFTNYEEGRPWVAYNQFCRHFLAPLALAALVDVRLLELQRSDLDGVPLDLASDLLPTSSWLRSWIFAHIHFHARAIKRFSPTDTHRDRSARRVSRAGIKGLTAHLTAAIESIKWNPVESAWADYSETHGYDTEAHESKVRIVEGMLRNASPSVVLDMGSNVGEYSRIARRAGAVVIAVDGDPSAVEMNFRRCVSDGETGITPLWIDLTNPSPAQGWAGNERESFADRASSDMVLVLALVHHLAISHNVPLHDIAAYVAVLGAQAIIEWIPKSDLQLQRLLTSREDVFSDYTEQGFRTAIEEFFVIHERVLIHSSHRVIYRVTRKQPDDPAMT